jgi:hypothetical protein
MNVTTKRLLLALVIVGVGVSMFATTHALADSNQNITTQSGTLNDDSWCDNHQMHQDCYQNQPMDMHQLSGQHHWCML